MHSARQITTIETGYTERERFAAAYLLHEGDQGLFVETNTALAVPRLLAALADAGLSPEQVPWVIVTHVHLDHAGGASVLMDALPNATLLAHPRAAPHLIDPSRLVSSASKVYGEERFRALYGEIRPIPEERVRIMDDGEHLAFGGGTLTFLHTRGHANHHFCIHDDATEAVFTGDTLGIGYPDLQEDGRLIFPSTSPTDFDAAAARDSLTKIVATGATRAFLTHFGEHGDVPGIAAELDAQLQVYGALADQAYAEVDDAELDGWCSARVDTLFDTLLKARPGVDTPDNRALLAIDAELNAQGLAFSVRRRRRKAARG